MIEVSAPVLAEMQKLWSSVLRWTVLFVILMSAISLRIWLYYRRRDRDE